MNFVNYRRIVVNYPKRCLKLFIASIRREMEFQKPSAWKGLEKIIPAYLKDVHPVSRILEIGVDYGYSLFYFAKMFPYAEVIGVDPFKWFDEQSYDHSHAEGWVEKYMRKYPNIRLIKKNSEEARKIFNKEIDILHIDAEHKYQSVRKDFCLYEPLVRQGGVILLHDIVSYPDDIGRFFNEIEGGRKERILSCQGLGIWYKNHNQPSRANPDSARTD